MLADGLDATAGNLDLGVLGPERRIDPWPGSSSLVLLFVVAVDVRGGPRLGPSARCSRSTWRLGVALGLLIVAVETRLRRRRGHRSARRADRRRHRAGLAQDDRRGAVLGRHRRPRGRLPAQLHPAGVPLPRARAWARAKASGWSRRGSSALFRDAGPQKRYRILDTSVIIDGRIADICETGFLDGTLVDPAVRAEGAAARRRFRRLDEAQPRPPRPRHPAEDPEDGRRRRA